VARRAFLVLAAGLIAAAAFAQTTEPAYLQFNDGVGFSVGRISGYGISFRHWFSEKVGLQVCAGGLYFPSEPGSGWIDYGTLLQYWSGLEVFRSLYATEFTKWLFGQVYLFAGATHYGNIPWEATLNEDGYTYTYTPGVYVPGFGLGGGVGIEMTLFRHFSMVFELGYAAFWEPSSAAFKDQLSVDLVPQGVAQFRY